MRVFTIIFSLLLMNNALHAQNGGSLNSTTDKSYIPNITPPSPQSFNMTKYGDLPVNEFYGKTAINIPIYNYKSGQLNIGLILNHDGSGVKVDDISNWAGSNWTLDTGGIITRTINDLADDSGVTRKYIANKEAFVSQYNTADGSAGAIQLVDFIKSSTVDTEVDIFNYTIPGYSGSFYLDENFNPILTKHENELKINKIGNFVTNSEFVITTPNGVKFYFGGANGTESTFIRLNPYGGGKTSFFLTKIEHPINGKIFYEYHNVVGTILNLSKQQSLNFYEKTVFPDVTAEGLTYAPNQQNCPQNFGVQTNVIETNLNQLRLTSHKYLYRIYSDLNNEIVYFNSEDNPNTNIDRILNSIEVKNNNNLIHKINFSYYKQLFGSILHRIFLTKLEINKELQNSNLNQKKYEEYSFQYNSPEQLPKRLSFSQDFLGFFNGKYNTTLLPNSIPSIEEFEGSDSNSYQSMLSYNGLANRTPDFNFATKGILTDVYYPTGGHTHFEYEPEIAKEKKYISYSSGIDGYSVPRYDADCECNIVFKPVYENQEADVFFSLTSDDYEYNHFCQASLIITDVTPDVTPIAPAVFVDGLGSSPAPPRKYKYTFIKDHIYKIEILPLVNSSCNIQANFWFKLFDGYKKVDNIGIRLKKQIDYTTANNSQNIKRYYYASPLKWNKSVEDLPFVKIPNYFYDLMINKLFDWSSCPLFQIDSLFLMPYEVQGYFKILTSNSYNNYFLNNNNSQNYNEVTISYGGDNFENGGVYKVFNKFENYSPAFLTPFTQSSFQIGSAMKDFETKRTNDNILNGDLIKEIYIKNINNNFYKQSETKYLYNFNLQNTIYNLIGKEVFRYAINTSPYNTTLSNCLTGLYDTKSFKKQIFSKTTKEYIDLIPISLVAHEPTEEDDPNIIYPTQDELEASYRKIITTQTYEYNTLIGLPTKITTNTSDNNITNVTENTYVTQASTLTGLTLSQIGTYGGLQSQNNVATPIEVRQYENANLLSKQRTLYKQDANYNVLPEKIQTAKGSQNLEDRAVFEEYDNKGNPTLMYLNGGSKTKYLYNTNNQVIVKIENFTGTLDPNTTAISGDPCVFINQYPNSLVTVFTYDSATNLLIQTMDSNCRKSTYVYDALHRLQQIKDNDGNVIKEFDNNYRPQN